MRKQAKFPEQGERGHEKETTFLRYYGMRKKREERMKETFTGALAGGFERATVNDGGEQAHSLVDGGLGVFHGEVDVVPLPRHCPTSHPLHCSSPIKKKEKKRKRNEKKRGGVIGTVYRLSTNNIYMSSLQYLSILNGLY